MPIVSIDLHEGATDAGRRRRISDAIHEAMQRVLGIPADDRFHTFSEHPDGNLLHEDVVFGIPRDRGLMFITFSFNQRDPAQKQRLYEETVRLLAERADVTRDQVFIRVIETAAENWWASGRNVDPATGYDERMDVARTT